MIDPVTLVGAILASALMGVAKRNTTVADREAAEWVKPLQPLVVLAAALGCPWAADAVGALELGPGALEDAPAAALAVITARELLERRARAKKRPRKL